MQEIPEQRRDTLLREARRFLNQGFAPIPCPRRGTVPVISHWPGARLTAESVGRSFADEDNIGLLLGAPSNGLVVVELKCDEAKKVAPEFLRNVRMISGRASTPDSNWWLQIDHPPATACRTFDDPSRNNQPSLLDVKSTGAVALVPPSIYPADPDQGYPQEEPCVLSLPFPPLGSDNGLPPLASFQAMPITEFETAVGAISTAVLLARSWPNIHRVSDFMDALVKLLHTRAWSDERFKSFGNALIALTGDVSVRLHIASTLKQLEANPKPVDETGAWETLSQEIGPAGVTICASLRAWLFHSPHDPLPASPADPRRPLPGTQTIETAAARNPQPPADPKPVSASPPQVDIRAAARQFIERGLAPVPLPPRSSTPVINGWQHLRVSLDQVDSVFASDDNIGLLLGAPSNGLVVVDLKCVEARRAASGLLPPAFMTSGRKSTPDSHYWFVVDNPPTEACRAYGGPESRGQQNELPEFRSTGAITAVPPSLLPSESTPGQPIEERCVWSSTGAPVGMGRVDLPELVSAIGKVAAAALLAKSWPRDARTTAGEALVELLMSAGWDGEPCKRLVWAVCHAAEDPKFIHYFRHLGTLESQPVTHQDPRWLSLAESLGPRGREICANVGHWLSIPVPDTVSASPPLQEAADQDAPPPVSVWPTQLDDWAYRGLAREFVDAIDPATEADRVAILGQFLVYFGNIIGRRAFLAVEADRHYPNENLVLIGSTSKGRKGTSHGHVHRTFAAIDPEWGEKRVLSGIASGAGLIWAVRDPVEKSVKVKERGETPRFETITADIGECDKRLLCYEPEFVNVLTQIKRRDNSLSPIIRQSWETGNLRILTKNSSLRSSDAHISIIGHITEEELVRHLHATETANGFGNRFIWIVTRRSKLLPCGGQPDPERISNIRIRLGETIRFARGMGEVRRDAAADAHWREIYAELAADRAGLSGSLLGRAEAHTMRLALIYALLDSCNEIGVDHLKAAHALWKYSERSVVHVFGDSLGNPLAERLLQLLRNAGPMGLARTELSDRLGRNVSSHFIGSALLLLHRLALIRVESMHNTGGRPAERWFPIS